MIGVRISALGVLALLLPGPMRAQSPDSTRLARVTYVTGASAYIDAGREQGLREGASVELLRDGKVTATLTVTFLSSRQSACSLEGVVSPVVVGDTVRYSPSAPTPSASAVAEILPSRPTSVSRGGRLRGRIGARYLSVRQRDGSLSRYSAPALDLRLDGNGLAGSSLGLQVDVRARRVTGTHADGTREEAGRTRVYQAALLWRPSGTPVRVTAGRQFTPGGASVNLLDGVLTEVGSAGWAAGAFAGTEPDPADLALSGAVRDFGGYVELRSRPLGTARGFIRTGAVGSYAEGVANREFAYLQGGLTGRRFSVFVSQELDYYRPWKRDSGDAAVSPTSTFATLYYQPVSAVALTAGLDHRRNVLLYQDVVTPETVFDDSFRYGAWAGLSLAVAGRYRFTMDARSSSGGEAGRAMAYTGSAAVTRLTRYQGELRLRTTRYEGPRLSGWIHALSAGFEPAAWGRAEVSGGIRDEHDPLGAPSEIRVSWATADADLSIARGWYLLVSLTREWGAFESNDQFYGGLSYRF
jgi:hypothetical protein